MKIFALLLLVPMWATAADHTVLGDPSGNDNPGYNGKYSLRVNSSGQITQTLQAGEDQTNNVQRVETQMSSSGTVAVDTQIKATPGYVDSVSCIGLDAAAIAGTIILHDATTETAGTTDDKLTFTPYIANYSLNVITWPLHTVMATGIYLGFTTTTDIACTVSYR
jgi:hypothetical protein